MLEKILLTARLRTKTERGSNWNVNGIGIECRVNSSSEIIELEVEVRG